MPSLEVLIAFATAAIIMSASPGPSNMYVMARTIEKGFLGGLEAALGLAVGCLIHVVAASLGLAAIFKHSPEIYLALKLAGAAYLIYLGISYWLTAKKSSSQETLEHTNSKTNNETSNKTNSNTSAVKVFIQSVIVELTNPKTALFFIAFLPQFVNAESGSVPAQLFILGMVFTTIAFISDLMVASFSSKISHWLKTNPKAQLIQDKICGGILAALGVSIILEEAQTNLNSN
ncbi:Homoserine/homoserine lactone efflux protein [Thalassocella blandensis]|nr:Homoserine/homoserine lactone efflux protein [Thalassocella blandensis]